MVWPNLTVGHLLLFYGLRFILGFLNLWYRRTCSCGITFINHFSMLCLLLFGCSIHNFNHFLPGSQGFLQIGKQSTNGLAEGRCLKENPHLLILCPLWKLILSFFSSFDRWKVEFQKESFENTIRMHPKVMEYKRRIVKFCKHRFIV